MTRIAAFAPVIVTVAVVAVATPAFAQPLTREDLEAALRQRDQEIAILEKRVAALEAERGAAPSLTVGATGPATAGDVAPPPPAPTEDEVALQALSRGLVQRGVLLLPKWSIEASPSLAYSHTLKQGLVLVDTPQGISTVSDQRQRQDSLQGSVAFRVGLPWQSQLRVSVPFDWKRDASALGDGTSVVHTGANVGDVEVELSHQFLIEQGWRPDLVGAVSWRFPTGSDPYRLVDAAVATGGGTNQVTARLTALKTIDPLVVFSTLSYSANLTYREPFGRVHAGDTVDWQLGALLAVSPETSLSVAFAQEFRRRTSVDGVGIKGSDGVAAVLQFGLDQVLNSRALVDLSVGVGVTRDAPDYTLMVSVPIRFR